MRKQESIEEKLMNIVKSSNKTKMYPQKDIEIENAKIKNITQAIAAYGAQKDNFIGMLTLTFGRNKYDRILTNDYESTIKRKTKIMYDSVLYYIDQLKRLLSKKKFNLIYIAAFELQKDGTFHTHIYFSLNIKAFEILFKFYNTYSTSIVTEKKEVLLNKKKRVIIPVGRCQLGVATQFKTKLEKEGFRFIAHKNNKSERIEFRCLNFVNDDEFMKGAWPTLYFYGTEELKKHYGEKIIKYLTKNYTKSTRQKAIGSQYVKHNLKTVYEPEENWSELQKKFIRKICKKLYVASKLPIQISFYQKKRKEIIKIYPQYKNLNTLISDLLNGKAKYEKGILICPNNQSLKLK